MATKEDWTILSDYLGGEEVAGGKLKEAGLDHWASPNTEATNETGFSALPGGFRHESGQFGAIRRDGAWWSATEMNAYSAYVYSLNYYEGCLRLYDDLKGNGFSVRLVKD